MSNMYNWLVPDDDRTIPTGALWRQWKWTEKINLGICRRIVKCLNIVQLEILRPTFKNFTLSATGFGNFLDSFNISDECWFQKRPIGKDTLASFMFTLSKKQAFHKSTPTTPFVQRVQLSSEETVQWHKLWQLPDTNLPRQLQYRATISTILNNATAQYFRLQPMPSTQNSSSSISLVQMRANTHVSSSVTDVVDILDVIMMIYFVIITLLQQLIPSQTPEQFSKPPCSTAVPLQSESKPMIWPL